MIEQLRQRLQSLERTAGIEGDPGVLPLGIGAIDQALGGGLARGALHEIAAPSEAHLAAATGFVLGVAASPSPRVRGEGTGDLRPPSLLPRTPTRSVGYDEGAFPNTQSRGEAPSPARLRYASAGDLSPHAGRGKSILWIAEDMALTESGALHGPGLDQFNLAPERLLTVAAAHRRDLLWAMEEALRCRAIGAVIGELRHGDIDPVAVRRLSLAAASTSALALLLRAQPASDASTAATRWIVGAAPTLSSPSRGDERKPRFAAHLMRNRRGPTGSWILQWSDSDERFVLATHAQPVAAPALDRPHRKVA